MFPFAFAKAGSQKVVDSMYRANNVWLPLSRQSMRAIGWFSVGLVGREYAIWPQGSLVVGSILAIFTAAGLSSAGSMRLFTNPNDAGSARLPCARHCAEATVEKSPLSIAAVGMNVTMSAGVCVARVP